MNPIVIVILIVCAFFLGHWLGSSPECDCEKQHGDVQTGDTPNDSLQTCKLGYVTTPDGCQLLKLGDTVAVKGHDGPPAAVCKPGDFHSGPRGVVKLDDVKEEVCKIVTPWFGAIKHDDVQTGETPADTLLTCKIGFITTHEGCKLLSR